MRIFADIFMFGAGLALGITVFQSPVYGVIAGLILGGATESYLGGAKRG